MRHPSPNLLAQVAALIGFLMVGPLAWSQTIDFQTGASSVTEANTTHSVIVVLSVPGGPTGDDITVDVTDLLTGSANSGIDYTALPSPITLTFPIGSTDGATLEVPVSILEDLLIEGSEGINLALSNPSGGGSSLGTTTAHAAKISDDETGTVQFQAATSSVGEAATTHEVIVVLSTAGVAANDLTVDITDLLTGTATSATDYSALASPVTVTFSAGATNGATEIVSLIIQDDAISESDETVNLRLSNQSSPLTLGTSLHTATINDDDPSTVQFVTSTSSVGESPASFVQVYITLDVPGGGTLPADLDVDIVDLFTGTATSGADYDHIFSPVSFNFPAGSADGTSQSLFMTFLADAITEGTETINLELQNISGGVLGATTAHVVSIIDLLVEVSFATATSSVGEANTTHNVVAALSLSSGTLPSDVTVEVSDLLTGSATSDTDYTALAAPLTITFPTGSADGATAVVPLAVLDDLLAESAETLNLQLANPSGLGATLTGTTNHVVTINDDETFTIEFTNGSSSLLEATANLDIPVSVTISGGGTLSDDVTVDVTDLLTGTATSDTDYTALATPVVLTFSAGASSGDTEIASIPVQADTLFEGNETVNLQLSNPSAGSLGSSTSHTGTIIDSALPPTFEFASGSSATVNEATANLNVPILINLPVGTTGLDITIEVSDLLTGSATSDTDYTSLPAPQTLTFSAGAANGDTIIVALPVIQDPDIEGDETVNLQLQNPSAGSLATTSLHVATITDDDAATIAFSAATSSDSEANTTHNVVVALSIPGGGTLDTGADVTVDVNDAGSGTATSATDYTALASPVTLSFPPGSADGATALLPISILDDALVEGDETLDLTLSNIVGSTQVTLGAQTTHEVTITDNDAAGTVEFQTAASATVDESSTTFDVVLVLTLPSGTLAEDVVVDVTDLLSGTATSATDYAALAAPVTVTFSAGSATGATTGVPISVIQDPTTEGNEAIDLQITAISGAASAGAQTTHEVTITDDDNPFVSFASTGSTVTEDTTTHTVTVALSIPGGGSIPTDLFVDVSDVAGDTATSNTDYIAITSPVTLSFPAASADGATAVLPLDILEDLLAENNETIDLELSNVSGGGGVVLGAPSSHTVTILDDETISVAFDTSTSGLTESTTNHDVPVLLTVSGGGSLANDVTVEVSDLLTGTATSATDYTALASPVVLTFTAGASDGDSQVVQVPVLDDALLEPTETVDLRVQNPTNATLGASTNHTVAISDDDTGPSVAFQSATSATANEASGNHPVVLVLSVPAGPTGTDITLDITDHLSGSATSATDYTALASPVTVTFSAGSTDGDTVTLNIPVLDDIRVEGDETVNLSLSNVTGGATPGAVTTHQATITDDDTASVSFQTTNSSVNEANTTHSVVIVLSIPGGGTLDDALTIDALDFGGGSAAVGTDYTALASPVTLTFSPGSADGATVLVPVSILDDLATEPTETVELTLANPSTPLALGATTAHAVNILDDDSPIISFQAASSSVTEASTTHNVVLVITTTAPTTADITFEVTDLLSGSATTNTDYATLASPVTLTFTAGATSGDTLLLPISILPDAATEGNETIDLQLGNPSGTATLGTSDHVVTILDDDFGQVQFQAATSSVGETSSTLFVVIELTGGGALPSDVTVQINDLLTGTATSDTDYTSIGTPVTITFPTGSNPGDTQQLAIPITSDTLVEGNETLNLRLSTLTGPATLGSSNHTATITDDDLASFTFKGPTSSVAEANTTHNLIIVLGLPSGSLPADATVEVADLLTGTATAATDYTFSTPLTVTFTAGSTSGATAIAPISILDDLAIESSETIDLQLQNPSALGSLGSTTNHTATITDDDIPTVDFQAATSSVGEATTTHNVVVVLTTPAALPSDVTVHVTDLLTGSATSNTDYNTFGPLVLTFTTGSTNGTTQIVPLSILDDLLSEGNETLNLALSNPTSVLSLGTATTHAVTILDDEAAVIEFQSATSSGSEGDGVLTVILELASGTAGIDVTVDINDLFTGSATSATDYTALPTPVTVTFTAGSTPGTTRLVLIPVTNDGLFESDETIDLRISNPTGSGVLGSQTNHEVTILDNDVANFTFQSATSSVTEANTTHNVVVVLQLPGGGPLPSDFTVDVFDIGGTATTGTDYTSPVFLTLTFASGANDGDTQVIPIPILDDAALEPAETVNLLLSNPSAPGQLGGTTAHTLTINDDDFSASVSFQNPTSASAAESGTVNIVVELTATGGTAPADIVASINDLLTGSATSATDYTALGSPVTVTFSTGAASGDTQVIPITILPDATTEGNETIDLRITAVSGPGSVGATSNHELTISDDDGSFVAFQTTTSSVGEANTTHNVIVELNIPSGTPLTGVLSVDVTDLLTGSATSAGDYTSLASPVTLNFPPGSNDGATQLVPISILDDLIVEGNETIDLQLSNVVTTDGVVLATPTNHTVTIVDDENAGTVDFQLIASSINENNVLHFIGVILTLDAGVSLGNEVTVDVADLLSGTATSATDYTAVGTTTLSFPVASTSGTGLFLQVPILHDTIGEANETIDLALQNVTGPASLGPQTAHEITIIDNDGLATFQVATSTVTETNTIHNVVVELVASSALATDSYIEISDLLTGTATSASDYTALATPVILTFTAGSTNGDTQVVPITILNDSDTEGPETISLRLASSGTLGLGSISNHTVTINDDESDPIVQFQNATSNLTEATTNHNILIELTLPSGGSLGNNLTVNVTDLLTGTATSDTDYTALAAPELITFPAGTATGATQTVTVPVLNDFIIEGDETVDLRLSNPSFGVLGSTTNHALTINDGEFATIGYRTAASSVGEANTTHEVIIDLTITGAGALADDLVISYSDLLSGTATSTADYSAITTTQVTFAAGTGTSQTAAISIPILDDLLVEGAETINLDLQVLSGSATTTTTTHAVTIVDDEAGGTINLQLPTSSMAEADPIHFIGVILTLSGGSTLAQPVVVEITDQLTGTATSSSDYTALATPIVLTFPNGSTSGTALFFDITPVNDAIGESDETINLDITNISGPASLGVQTSHVATILDDDISVTFALGSSSVSETGGTHQVIVTLSTGAGPLTVDATVEVTDLLTGTATSATDYGAIGTDVLTFSAGSTNGATQVVSISILDDTSTEGAETINLRLQNPTGEPSLGATTNHIVTITDDDVPQVAFQAATSSVGEGNVTHTVVVTLTTPGGTIATDLTVDITDTGAGTATSATDYTAFPLATVTFSAGSASGDTQVITLTILDDTDDEGSETINLQLSNPSGGPNGILGAQTTHVVTITDNDALEVTKTVSATDQAHTTGTNVTIGEVVTYQYQITVPETAAPINLRSTDTLPANITYQAGTVSVTTGAAMSIASTTTTWTQPTLQIDWTTFVNTPNGDGSDDILTVTYQALVANTATNENGQTKTNTVQITDFSDTVSDSATVTVVEPDITVSKAASNITRCDGVASTVHLGDVLAYTLTVTETNGVDAFDLSITDVLDEGLAYDTSFTPTVTGAGNTISAASTSGTGGVGDPQTITWSLALGNADIDVSASSNITITYRVTVLATATPSATLSNTATIGFSSLDGAAANERSNASAPGSNDYQEQDTTSVSVKPSGTTHSIPASRRRAPTFIDVDGNITGPGGPAVLTANDTLSLTDGAGVTITGDGISGPPPAGAPDITVVASATATIITDGTASFEYGVVTINTDATLTLTGDTTINFEQIVMSSGSTLILPDGSTLTITGPCELNGDVGTSNYVTIQAAGSGPLSINFSCSFTGDHFVIEDIGTGTITFSGDTQMDYAIFRDGSGAGPYIQYDDDDDVTWTNLAFECTKTTIQTGVGSGNVTVDGYAQTIATRWCGGDSTDSENGGTVTWLNATPVRHLSGTATPATEGGILVQWTTTEETMTSHFDVQRQITPTQTGRYQNIGREFAIAPEFGNASYSFLDRHAKPGTAYRYRIAVVDANGTQRWYELGQASAHTKAAPEPIMATPRAEETPTATAIAVTIPEYSVSTYTIDTPAMKGLASKATISATGLYTVPGSDPVYSAGHRLTRLGDGSIVFARQLADYYTESNALWTGTVQVIGQASQLPAIVPAGRLTADGYLHRFRAEANQSFSVNSGLPAGPNWYYSQRVNSTETMHVDVDVSSPRAGTATLIAATRTSLNQAHELRVSVNGVYLGTGQWFGQGHRHLTFTFDAGLLTSGANTVSLTTRQNTEHRLDWIEIEAPSVPTTGISISIESAGSLPVAPATLPVDITTNGAERLLTVQSGHIPVTAGQMIHLSASPIELSWSQVKELVVPSFAGIEYIAVAPAEWLDLLQPIIAKNQMRTLAISIEDVNDIFGAGRFGPAGLKNLSTMANADYLLLGASTTYDYKNYEGRHTPLGIPTGFIQVREGMAASDDLYTNNLTTAVGRLPARSASELTTMVNKIVEFEPSSRVLLLPDRNDLDGNINRFSEAQASLKDIVPSVLIDTETQTDEQVRADMIAAMQAGSRIVAYQGHAGFQEIGSSFVNVTNANTFPTSAWLLSTCLTGSYFINSEVATFARTLLNAPTGGGALVIASTRFGHADYEHQMINTALNKMASGGGSWGHILLEMKRSLDHETLSVFQLFGDPATPSIALQDPRVINLLTPQGGSFVGANGRVNIQFSLLGEGWWDEPITVRYRHNGGQWIDIQTLNAIPGQTVYSLEWQPPHDGTGYQIRIDVE